jgi:hypothetical protein
MPFRRPICFTRVALPLLASLVMATTHAAVTITLPEDLGQMPNYWSGTACRGWATATVVGTPQPNGTVVVEPTIVEARFYIGNQLVHTSRPHVGGPLLPSVTFDYRWDSTHFANGSTIKLRIEVVESTEHTGGGIGGTATTVRESVGRTAVNKITYAIDDDLWDFDNAPFPQLSEALNADGGYGVVASFMGLETVPASSVLNALAGQTTHFLFSGHGGYDQYNPYLQCGVDENLSFVYPATSPGGTTPLDDVVAARTTAMQIGTVPAELPPMNPGAPPIGIATLSGCEVLAFQPYVDPSTGFHHRSFNALIDPMCNWYSPLVIENQAVIGYTIKAKFAHDNAGLVGFYMALMDGATIWEAREAYIDAYNAYNAPASVLNWIDENDLIILGDPMSKFKGVYNGPSAAPLAWFTSNSQSAPGGPGL